MSLRWEQWERENGATLPTETRAVTGLAAFGKGLPSSRQPLNACVRVQARKGAASDRTSLARMAVSKTIPTLHKERKASSGAALRGKGTPDFPITPFPTQQERPHGMSNKEQQGAPTTDLNVEVRTSEAGVTYAGVNIPGIGLHMLCTCAGYAEQAEVRAAFHVLAQAVVKQLVVEVWPGAEGVGVHVVEMGAAAHASMH